MVQVFRQPKSLRIIPKSDEVISATWNQGYTTTYIDD